MMKCQRISKVSTVADQFLDLSGRMGYKLYLGEIMQSQITVTDITILERNQKKDEDD